MRVKFLVGVLVFLVVLNLAATTAFLLTIRKQPPPPRFDRGKWPARGELWSKVDHEDRERLRELRDEFRESTREQQLHVRRMEDEIFDLMREQNVDRERVDSLVTAVGEVQLQIGRKAIDHLMETREFLSPEQQEIFHRMILRRGHGSRGSHHRRPEGR